MYAHRLFALLALPLVLTLLPVPPARAAVEIQPVAATGGQTAWLVEDRTIPMVALELVFVGGAVLDAPGREGAVSLMTSLLPEGAGEFDAQGWAAALEDTAGSVGFSSGRDTVTLTIRALSENLDEVLELARLALAEPRFDAQAIERVRAQQLSLLERAAQNPNAIASRVFAELVWAGHPYARLADGSPETLAALTRDDLLAAHRAAFRRDRVFVGAAGDISAEALAEALDRLLGDLPAGGADDLPPYARFTAAAGVTVVDHPAPQSVVAFGHSGIHREDPDFTTAFVVNEIFGGGRFGTRLMSELRERRGLTYGVGTSVASGRFGDSFQGRLSTDNARVAEVIDLIRDEWAWLAGDGIDAAALERVQTYLTGAYPLRFNGNASIASIMASMQAQGFGIDYVNIRNDLIRAITPQDVRRVAARLADPGALVFVVVGRPQGLE